MKLRFFGWVMLTLGGLVSLAGAADTRAADAPAKLYTAKCAMCHGKDFKGNPAMAKMFKLEPSALSLVSKEVQAKKDADLTEIVKKGKNKMPALGEKLKPEEIAGLIAYIRSSAPKATEERK